VASFGDDGRLEFKRLEKSITPDTACVLIQSPNFFGTIEDVVPLPRSRTNGSAAGGFDCRSGFAGNCRTAAASRHHRHGSAIVWRAPGIWRTLLWRDRHARKIVRQMPGRLVGQTTDRNGKRGFVLTLATREQHIRREKATSNICTNQALVALMVNIFMTIYGKVGCGNWRSKIWRRPPTLLQQFGKHGKVLFSGAPRFNEFVVQTERRSLCHQQPASGHKIVGGLPLKKFYPELGNAALWCCTEMTTRARSIPQSDW
jgi:glycine dehydrogenase subunit 1